MVGQWEEQYLEASHKKRMTFIFALVGFAVLILGASLVAYFLNEKPQLKIDNFEIYYSDMPREERAKIFEHLYIQSKSNLYKDGTITPSDGAVIRDNMATNEHNVGENRHYGQFVVDIPSTEQSYKVYFEWSEDKNNSYLASYNDGVEFSCLTKDLAIYPDFVFGVCTDSSSAGDPIDRIVSDLPVHLKTEAGENVFLMSRNYVQSSTIYIEARVNSCGDMQMMEKARGLAEDFVKNYYLDNVPIRVLDLCDGEG